MNIRMTLAAALLLTASGATVAVAETPRPHAKNGDAETTDGTARAVDALKIDYDRFTLPNGLTVIVYPDHSQPKVTVSMTYRVGSKDEPDGKSGFAHLFEHLMFQETANRKGEYFTPLRDNGVLDMNGNTTTDRTRYYEVVPTAELDLALWLESDRMEYLLGAIDQAALDGQRAVVKNEKRQGETAASAAQMDATYAALYPRGHPYAHSVIGSMRDLDAASVADVRGWFENYYGAANAILLLAGDIDVATARAKVTKYFSDVRPGQRIQQIADWVPTLDRTRRLRFYDKVPNRQISRTWPVPSGNLRDGALLASFAQAIAGTAESPLNQALVEHDGPALGVMAMVSDAQVNGLFTVQVDLKPGADAAAVERRLDAALVDVLRRGPDPRLLRWNLESKDVALLSGMADPATVGAILEEGELVAEDPLFFRTVRDWERAATPAAIAAVARTWLGRPYLLTETLPEPRTEPAVAGSVDRSTMPAVDRTVAAPVFPPIERATLPNGAKIVVVRRPKVPLVNVSIQFETGRFIDRAYSRGLAAFTFGSLFGASAAYSSERIQSRMRELSIYPAASSDDRHSGVEFSTITPRLADGMAFVAEVIREPAFPQKKIDDYLAQVDQTFDNYERTPANAQDQLFARALWGKDHPYGAIDDRESARDVVRQELVDFHRNELAPSNMTVYFVGDVTLAQARALVERNFAGWHADARPARTIATPAPRPTGVRVVLIDEPGAEQSKILAGRLVAPWELRTAMTELLANGALGGGFTSRINMNLRENKGWTYGTNSSLGSATLSPRAFYVRGSVQTDATAPAIREIIREMTDFTTGKPITQQELDAERLSLNNQFGTFLSSNDAFVTAMTDAADRRMPLDFVTTAPAVIGNISLAEVRALATEEFRTDDFVWTIAGDLRKIEADVRALGLGPVEVQDAYGNRLR